ncbi:4-hydroxythreonine-4-phosphate dehydrogenase PdxA [Bartonella tamiae]|uniref:4-hydroxythreonine-4-phosphate dehydrogenase n=1 Tax=Bartonella tamiae Th239 TaxID=1094558 RepID=J1K0U6_9HYPH|nr:4-hydroxythreonine-4-phosphate dehydrogenase PdxA [Bartonella tamiae]EJF90670.1 4-hydroxythreonine-4-phosphate dehydrogenase [Bartonella tamiae Th239]EJF93953.1 4-hydroxythreonine-4-phosphate dehydrogenase [Bartonella tamiae Th307]
MKPLVISSGDPSGIGLEIVLKAWLLRHSLKLPPFFVIVDPALIKKRIAFLQLDVPIQKITAEQTLSVFPTALPIVSLKNSQIDQIALPSKNNARGIIESIERSVEYVINGRASGLVTCPISKQTLYEAEFTFPGHTEFLAYLAKRYHHKTFKPVMMLAGPNLRTIPITVHIALDQVPKVLTTKTIVETALIAEKDMKYRFRIEKPRLIIAGLNPHAGEGGAMGKQENTIIMPAIDILQKKGVVVSGPAPADTLFHEKARCNYDVALCMYHDQALIPVKTIGFDDTVNVTLGLPFIRTSPDHGTAFDIADKNIASPKSFIAALKLADELTKNSMHYDH